MGEYILDDVLLFTYSNNVCLQFRGDALIVISSIGTWFQLWA